MSRRNFSRFGKEKLVIYLTSALVVGACGITAYYVNRSQNRTDDGYIIDLAEIEKYHNEEDELAKAEAQEETGTVNSDSVVNDIAQLPSEALKEKAALGSGIEKTAERDLGHIEKVKIPAKKEAELAVTADSDSITNGLGAGSSVEKQPQVEDEIKPEPEISLQFAAEDKMMWPVSGDVLIAYSMDKTVYFPTLDQYKYNPAVYISGEAGGSVSAAAQGRVESIGVNEEIGQYLVMDFGSGYSATYGQLQDITVKEGDVAAKGQIIASLAAPTKYHSLEGVNLYFAVTKDGASIDPMEYLE